MVGFLTFGFYVYKPKLARVLSSLTIPLNALIEATLHFARNTSVMTYDRTLPFRRNVVTVAIDKCQETGKLGGQVWV